MDYRISHLAYRTKDMKATLDFYTNVMGFKHIFSIPHDDGTPWIEYVGTPDGKFLELFHPNGDEVSPEGSYMHLCLEVDDCAAAAAELESKGVALIRPVKVGKDGNTQVWVRDPDGRDIEIMQLASDSGQSQFRETLK